MGKWYGYRPTDNISTHVPIQIAIKHTYCSAKFIVAFDFVPNMKVQMFQLVCPSGIHPFFVSIIYIAQLTEKWWLQYWY